MTYVRLLKNNVSSLSIKTGMIRLCLSYVWTLTNKMVFSWTALKLCLVSFYHRCVCFGFVLKIKKNLDRRVLVKISVYSTSKVDKSPRTGQYFMTVWTWTLEQYTLTIITKKNCCFDYSRPCQTTEFFRSKGSLVKKF